MPKNFVSNKDESVRMFKSDFLEFFSKVHFSVPLFIFIPVIAYFIYCSVSVYQITFVHIVPYFLFGIGVWSLTEYIMHRFIFHFHPTSAWGKRIHFIFHGVHHDYPSDSKRLVLPPSVSVPLAFLFYYGFKNLLGGVLVNPFFAGFLLGYLFYDITHYAIHHFNMHNKFWLALKKHHMLHHYSNPTKGFGVSSTIWDHLIGTRFDKKNPDSDL